MYNIINKEGKYDLQKEDGSVIKDLTLEEAYSIVYFLDWHNEVNKLAQQFIDIPDNAQMFGDEIKDMVVETFARLSHKHLRQINEMKRKDDVEQYSQN